jgi:hypothetical protein
MRWKRILLKKLSLNQILYIFVNVALEILNMWALIRTVLILALVLTVVISSLISGADKEQIKGLTDENTSIVHGMRDADKQRG